MIFAAIGDIRGNMIALKCVLDLVLHEGIQTIVNTGDSVVDHPGSHEVIEVLRHQSIPSVQGERDRLLARFSRKHASLRERLPEADFEALERAYDLCTSRDLEYLASLPSRLSLAVDGVSIEVLDPDKVKVITRSVALHITNQEEVIEIRTHKTDVVPEFL